MSVNRNVSVPVGGGAGVGVGIGSAGPFAIRAGYSGQFVQFGQLVGSICLDPAAYGTHSLQRTKPTLIYRRTKNLRAVQLLLGYTKLESTVRYLASRSMTPW